MSERKLKKVVRNGETFYYDESNGELVTDRKQIEIVEAATRKSKIAEIESDPLNRLQEQTKANYEKMGLSAEEADVAARGRR